MLNMAMAGGGPALRTGTTDPLPYAERWPTSPTAGAFLLVLGICAAAGSFFDPYQYGRALVCGFSAGALAAVALARQSRALFGPARPRATWFVAAAILFEATGLGIAGQFVRQIGLPNYLLIASIVVALHFVIMAGAFGPRIAALGVVIVVWIAACVALRVDLGVALFGDGVLKAAYGGAMAWPLIARAFVASR